MQVSVAEFLKFNANESCPGRDINDFNRIFWLVLKDLFDCFVESFGEWLVVNSTRCNDDVLKGTVHVNVSFRFVLHMVG